jgi:DNA processing protein
MLGIGPDGPIGARRVAEVAPPADRDPEREAWIVLSSVDGLGPVGLGSLLRRFGDGQSILEAARTPAGLARIAARDGAERAIDRVVVDRIAAAATGGSALVGRVRELGLTVVTLEDPAYPRRLYEIEMPPHLLFVRGDPAAMARPRAVAIVGTRRATEYGRRIAARIGLAVADAGAAVVSGLAVGIDGAAHAAAVAASGPTVAVLGGGHAHLSPKAHERLAAAIVDGGGCVVSEIAPDVQPAPGSFPRRNRLVSGLADATVVVEAPLRSGALITASWALEQGRECHLVPGPLGAPMSAGCLAFLRDHVGLAQVVADIPTLMEDLGLGGATPREVPDPAEIGLGPLPLGTIERGLVRALARGAATVDELVAAVREPVATVLGGLTLLESRGVVSGAYGRYRLAGRHAGTEVA